MMWDKLKNIPPILVGQSIFTCLDLNSIARFETALACSEFRQVLHSFLSYSPKREVELHIPKAMTKLKWLQTHNYEITKAIVNLVKISDILETKMISEIELIDNDCLIFRVVMIYLQYSFYEKVVSVRFTYQQDMYLMEELFSRFHNLRELSVTCSPDGWMESALQGLYRGTNGNILIEKISIGVFIIGEGSVAQIAQYCPRLKSLSVFFEIAEDSLLTLSTQCPLLKELNIPCIPRIFTSQSAALCAPVLSCIHELSTSSVQLDSDGDIANYTMTVPYLTELIKFTAVNSNDIALMSLISQYCQKLESIDILENSTATPVQLLQLAQNCRHLHSLFISNEQFFTDEFIIGLAERCPTLQQLYISTFSVYNTITDASLLALSEHCLQLCELDLTNFTQLTESAILQLIHSCKHLHILNLPLNCLSEDTVLSLPVTAVLNGEGMTITFNT